MAPLLASFFSSALYIRAENADTVFVSTTQPKDTTMKNITTQHVTNPVDTRTARERRLAAPTQIEQSLAAAFRAGRNTTQYKTGPRHGRQIARSRKITAALGLETVR